MGAEWRFIWYQNMRTCGISAAFYYVALIVCIVIIMINLLMAIMLGNYDKARVFSDKKQVLEAFRILQAVKQDNDTLFDKKITSPYFLKYVPNYNERVKRKPKYTFERILDIIFKHEPKILHHIKHRVIKIKDTKLKKLSFADKLKHKNEKSSVKFVEIDAKFWE